MPFTMTMYVDDGCRGNGYTGALGATACVVMSRVGMCVETKLKH